MEAELAAAYTVPQRFYHSADHVEEVLEHFAEVAAGPGWEHPREVYLAVLYHDAIYEPGRRDNEARSADLAVRAVNTHLPDAGIDTVYLAELIHLTARHGHLRPADVDRDSALFLDCDMAILAAPAARFAAYDAAIAQEYRGRLPQWMFRHLRRRFLRGLLDAPRIYLSDYFHDRLDATARENLRQLLSARNPLKASAGR
ncbi:hypothetical protein N4264_25155 [Tahibacter amnicola]|uniref:Metal-dependent HD superfamily phosphohydrolase n=2 Tax=Tahibacter amnicola TaxID=2976241 RepID=A0ABY6BNY2_9GAMM|nr:hypothetical protein [Tahibacter amnicola]UXI70760.1 hypothetical protein N4264_25155 [Tahibacter amnicola]